MMILGVNLWASSKSQNSKKDSKDSSDSKHSKVYNENYSGKHSRVYNIKDIAAGVGQTLKRSYKVSFSTKGLGGNSRSFISFFFFFSHASLGRVYVSYVD
jgi:hypothetical protein